MARVLVAAHNHPSLHPGGTEIFAHDLFRAYQRAGCEALFLGATNHIHREARPGTSFQSIGDKGDEILLWSGHFDRFFMSQVDLYGIVPDIVELLRDFRPDVVIGTGGYVCGPVVWAAARSGGCWRRRARRCR